MVPLPCDDPERWQKLSRLFLLLAQCKRLKELEQLAVMIKNGARCVVLSCACPYDLVISFGVLPQTIILYYYILLC